MSKEAKGEFTVTMTPVDPIEGATHGRMLLEKQYTGDLVATATGEMLTAMGQVKGSAAYVAVETVTGSLLGKTGTFMLVHRGVMSASGEELQITVVPDSATGDLQGLTGTLHIDIQDGKHFYTLDSQLS